MSYKPMAAIICLAGIVFSQNAAIAINGTVKDLATQTGIQGAVVSLAATGLTTVTDNNGKYSFGTSVSAAPLQSPDLAIPGPVVSNNRLMFNVAAKTSVVRIDLYTLSGRLIRTVLDRELAAGNYRLDLVTSRVASQPSLLKVLIGKNNTVLRLPLLDRKTRTNGAVTKIEHAERPVSSAKISAAADTIMAWAVGYTNASLGINNLTGTYDLTLQRVVPAGQAMVLQSSQTADKVSPKPSLSFINDDGSALPTITITPATTYQTIVGFGAALTECAVFNLCTITAARKNEVLNAFFNPFTGAGYTVVRVSINSCDFSLAQYAYDNTAGDNNLDNFDISHEQKYLIPTVKQAMVVPGSNFRIFGSPWSPPAWMKSNGTMLNGGQLKSDCFSAWALYYVKYVNAMKSNGITIWGLTVQNEPQATQTWESCIYSSQQERDFVKNYLGPTLAKNNVTAKVMIWDHNKDIIVERATTVLSDTGAAKYVWGTAYHHYGGDHFDYMNTVHDAFPQKTMLGTENSVHTGFSEVERMAHEIIGDLNSWSTGYLTWNMVTDMNGGPFHDRSPGVPGDAQVDTVTSTVTYPPNYYYMTHFSKYMRPDAVRIGCVYSGTDLEATAVKNTNGVITVAVLNKTANAVNFIIKQGTQIIKPSIPAHSLMDIVY
jgi:glucosylceramidase